MAVLGTGYTQEISQWGDPVMGAKLSICLSNTVIATGSNVVLHCIIHNNSTNAVIYQLADTRLMFSVYLVSQSGKRIILNDRDKYGGDHIKSGRVSIGESRDYFLPLDLEKKIEPGSYKMIATQKIWIFKIPNRHDIQRGELVSNELTVELK